jgi:amphi-Trp domain-containing protein
MGKEIVLFKSEEKQAIQSVADFLHELADKLAQKEVILRQGEEEITVAVPDQVVLELKVEEEQKKGRTQRSLEVEIEWYEGDQPGGPVTLG